MADTAQRGTDDARLRALLERCLLRHFGVSDSAFHDFIEDNSLYREIGAGETLVTRGEPGQSVFFLLSGHMRALVDDQAVGEIGRGQTVGELALFTGRPRSADVVATRDSIVAEVTADVLQQAIAKQPSLAFSITGEIIERFQRAADAPPAPPVTTTVLALHATVDAQAFARELAAEREAAGDRVAVLDAGDVARRFGALSAPDTVLPRGSVSLGLGEMELEHDALIFVAQLDDESWAETAIHHSDEVVLLADAAADPAPSAREEHLLERRPRLRADVTLLLQHAPDTKSPSHTKAWLEPRRVSRHLHQRVGHAADRRRIGRTLSGRAVGLVLAGGGARGMTHLGILHALHREGVEFDMVGGTSAGSIMGSFAAMDVNPLTLKDATRNLFTKDYKGNITGDYNWLPYQSLLKGERANAAMRDTVARHAVPGMGMEDTWKPFFLVVSDFSAREEMVLDHGDLARAVVASSSIPGIMPPTLIDGHLIYDGGSFNNFPVDHMRARGVRHVIGVDLMGDAVRRYDAVPTNRAALWDRITPGRRKHRVPPLPATLLLASTVTSMSRQKAARDSVDLLLKPKTRGLTLLSWSEFDRAWDYGVACVEDALPEADPDLLHTLTTGGD